MIYFVFWQLLIKLGDNFQNKLFYFDFFPYDDINPNSYLH